VEDFLAVQAVDKAFDVQFRSDPVGLTLVLGFLLGILQELLNKPVACVPPGHTIEEDPDHREFGGIRILVDDVELQVVMLAIESVLGGSMQMELQWRKNFLQGRLIVQKQVLIICRLDVCLEGCVLVINLSIKHDLLACEEGEGADRLEIGVRHELGSHCQFTIEGTRS
jgi:hypothetical protein